MCVYLEQMINKKKIHYLVLLPSTISSKSSTKNSFKGGLLGLFKVLSNC